MTFKLREYFPPDFETEFFKNAPQAETQPCPKDAVAPDNFHAMSIFPEYFHVGDDWLFAKESRMDCVPVLKDGQVEIIEPRRLKKGDLVFVGRTENSEEGIYIHANGFKEETATQDLFSFRRGRSRETAFSRDYDEIYELLEHEKKFGKTVWVIGPAFTFDADARRAFSGLVAGGYVGALLSGNALATHDLEAAYMRTALGQDIYTQEPALNGHYNHLETINKVKYHGSIAEFIKNENITDGIIYNCEKHNVPYVLAGSIRDDGPLPPVFANVYDAALAMREQIRGATTVICMATMLHTIATGNMTPSFRVMKDGTVRQIYFYCVDISEFTVNKLADRGSLCAKAIVTNVQDFIVHLAKEMNCY